MANRIGCECIKCGDSGIRTIKTSGIQVQVPCNCPNGIELQVQREEEHTEEVNDRIWLRNLRTREQANLF